MRKQVSDMTFPIGWPLTPGARTFGCSQILPANQAERRMREAGQYRNEKGGRSPLQLQSTADIYQPINEKGNHLQTPALATRTVGHAEELMDTFMEIVADGVITPIEISATNKLIRQVYSSAMETDLAQAAGIAVMRTGTDGKRAKELMGQIDAA